MREDELDPHVTEAARDYHAPPATPRDAMWAAIRAAAPQTEQRRTLEFPGRRGYRPRSERLRSLGPWLGGLLAAAAVTVAFGLGRVTGARSTPEPGPASSAADAPAASVPVRLAAANHMEEAEAMLTLYRTSERRVDRAATTSWAHDLLTTTRLLLDSRVGDDPRVAELLGDLELVLVQIVNAGAADDEEQELIQEGIEQNQLLSKLRSASRRPPEHAM